MESTKIKIFYDGKYPNLCSGKLIVAINGKQYGHKEEDGFKLVSGGSCEYDKETSDVEVTESEWEIKRYPSDFPEDMKQRVLDEINKLIPHGCCGGCE